MCGYVTDNGINEGGRCKKRVQVLCQNSIAKEEENGVDGRVEEVTLAVDEEWRTRVLNVGNRVK